MPEPRPGAAPRGVLVTRPEPDAAETAARLATLGWRPVLAPALVLSSRHFRPLRAQALLLTSRAAARALSPWDIPVLAVGEATAEAARERGFTQVFAADGDAVAMVAFCAERLDPKAGPLLLAIGEGYSIELAAALRAQGFRVVRRVVYAAEESIEFPNEALDALRNHEVSHALFFSPRSARCSVRHLTACGLSEALRGVEAIAISPRVAAVLEGLPWRSVRTATRPDQDHILELLGPT
ncbi:uroporphyrinogen-III synthase [Roseococcus pinisoli]|uniref:Uroporphyrinogen-III synthase n=1 Tax=Roseococcus pinisoli TaxID=2835040 RepID=A0ABS5QAC3_9PROT|nr:uroporphyrinogen-III synthase [Roseococcus pinisoli]MBS7810646.1 uroporphyrinogen-III synthase [Roseococcus pinisoli]